MVNEVILDYLRKYKDTYPLMSLKEKIMSRGYSEAEFTEALNILNTKQAETIQPKEYAPPKKELPFTPKSIIQSSTKTKHDGPGFNWMKLGAITGFIFIFLMIGSTITSFLGIDLPSYFDNSLTLLGATGFLILLLLFTYLGFVRMSSFTKSSLLNISSTTILIIYILGAILLAYLNFTGETEINQLLSSDGLSTMNAPLWISAILAFMFFILVILFYLLATGLIKSSIEVKFAKIAGIGNLIYALLLSVIIIAVLISLFLGNSYLLELIITHMFSTLIILGIVLFLTKIFESLTLIHAATLEY